MRFVSSGSHLYGSAVSLCAGLLLFAVPALPQAYTVSAKPGVVNFVEGTVYLNGNKLSTKATRATFLAANDTLSTDAGKAEVLLSPGTFLRIGDDSEVRMVKLSLVDPQLEVEHGEAIVEVNGLVKDNSVQLISHGASITVSKDGLYRIAAPVAEKQPPTFAVLSGKAAVAFGDKSINLGKNRETVLTDELKSAKFDSKKPDDLYAWSNVRASYDAAASYQTASYVNNISSGNTVYSSGLFGGSGFNGFGSGSAFSPGWYWADGFNSYAWLPGNSAFYNPFGYGFYGPGVVAYAPVVSMSGLRAVPVNPNNPPAVGSAANSPAAYQAARSQTAQAFANSGFRTATGAPVGAFTSGGRMQGVSSAGHVGVASANARFASAGASGGAVGGHVGHPSSGFSGGAGHGGGHAGR